MGGKTATISNSEQRLLSLQVQQSSQGLTLPVVYGRTRIAGNLIWYGDFAALEHKTVTRSGKGGGGVKQVDIKYDYEAAVALALCEGEIQGVTAVWRDKEKFTRLADLGLTLQNGSRNQPVWGHLQTKHPDQALSYSDTAYVYGATYRLTKSAQIHSHNFEVAGKLAYSEHIPDANPRDVLVDLLTNPNYGCGFPAENLADTDVYSTYCRALGLFVSPAYAEQNEAQQVLSELLEQTHSAAVFSEGRLKIIPYGDAPASGNGAVYVPNLTPVYDLTDDDYIVSGADDPVRCERKAAADAYNQVQIEYLDRSNDYNIAVAEAKDQANIEKYGLRPKDAVKMHAVCDKAVAQRIAQLLLQRGLYVRNEYEFKLGWKYVLLEPMDLVTLTDAGLGLDKTPVRIIEIDEDADGMLTVRAEDFPFGVASATTYPTQGNDGYAADYNVAPQNTYAPAIFEAPLQLTNGEPQIWLAASGGEHWGGCEVWVSGDGDSYVRAGSIHQKARYGSLTAPLPAGAVYDNANRAAVQLLSGSLQGVSENDARDMLSACLVGNEFLAFADAELTGVGQYRLSKLVRGAWGSAPESHAAGTRFVRVDDALFRHPFSPEQMGKTVYIKLISFNIFGAALQDLSEVPAYPYTIVGAPLGQVSNLRLTSEWAWGKQCALAWDKLDGADSYDVEVYAANSQNRLRLINGVVDNRYTYTLADMQADGGQVRDVVFKVRGRAVTGKTGKWTQLVARNPQLKALQGIELESGLKQAFFKCAAPQEDDFAGLLLWVSEQADCPAVPENLAYDGADTFVIISKCKGQPLQGGKTYYVRAAGYDSFDKQQLNISSSHAFTVYEVNAIAKELSESNLAGSLKERIGKIDGNGAGSVNARIAEEASTRAQSIAAEARARAEADRAEAQARAAALQQETQARTTEIRREADKQTAALRAESGKLNTAIASAAQTARQELAVQVAQLTAKDSELKQAQTVLDGKAAELTRTAQQLGNRIAAAESVNREQATAIQTVTAAQGRTAAALEAEKTARAQGDAAEARARETLAATVGQQTAALSAERQARIDGDAANTRELTAAKSRIAEAVSSIGRLEQTVSTQNSATASRLDSLTAKLGADTNLINPATTQAGHYISESNGSVLDWSGHVLTDFVPVAAGQTYTFTSAVAAHNLRYAWYNAQREFVSGRLVGGAVTHQTLIAPADAAFVRLSGGVYSNTRAFALRLDPTAAAVEAERIARVEADNALTQRLNTANSRLQTAESALQTEQRTRAEADRAEAAARQTLAGKVDGNTAALAEVREAKADKTQVGALARQVLSVEWQRDIATAKAQAQQAAAQDAQAKADAARQAAERAAAEDAQTKAAAAQAAAQAAASAEIRAAKEAAAADAQRKADAARTAAASAAETADRNVLQQAAREAQTKADAAKRAAETAASADATAKANAAKAQAIADAAAKDAVLKREAAADAQAKADAVRRIAEAAQRAADTVAADLVREQQTRAAGDEANAREITAAKARLGTAESNIGELRQTTARQGQALAEAQNSLTARIDGTAAELYARDNLLAADIWEAGNIDGTGADVDGYPHFWRIRSDAAIAVNGGKHYALALAGGEYSLQWSWYGADSRLIRADWVTDIRTDSRQAPAGAQTLRLSVRNRAARNYQIADAKVHLRHNHAADTAAVSAELTEYKRTQAATDAAQTDELRAAKSQIGQQTAQISRLESTKADQSSVSAQLQTTLQSAARDAQSKADAAQQAAERTATTKAAEAQAAAERTAQLKADAAKAAAIADAAAKVSTAQQAAAADAQRKADAARTAAASAAETADRNVLQQAAREAQAKADAAKRAAETAASADATAKANAAKAQAKADAAADASSKADAAKNAAIAEAQRLNTAANARINELQNTVANNREAAATQISSLTAKLGADTNLINPATTQAGHYISESNGNVLNWASHVLTDFVPVSAGQTYTFTSAVAANNLRWAWYNAQREFVAGQLVGGDSVHQTLIAPADAAFVRISGGTNRNTGAFALRLDPTAAELSRKADAAKHTELDLTALDADTWYPVTFGLRTTEITVLRVAQGLQSGKHNPPWATHGSRSFSLLCEWETNGHGWGAMAVQRTVRQFEYGWTRDEQSPLLNIGQLGRGSNEYCLLRGGAKYDIYTPPYITPVLRTEAYTAHSQTVSPLTAYNVALVPKATLKQALADISAEREARVNADNAQTAEITAAKSQIGNNTAAIDGIRSTKADKTEVAALARTSLASEWTAAAQTAKTQAVQAAATDAQAKATAAQRAAEQAAERLATAKANAAQAAAVAAASGDAQRKADAAKAAAIADAAAKDEAVARAAAADAQQKAETAKQAAIAEAQRLNTVTNARVNTLEQTVSSQNSATASRFATVEASVQTAKNEAINAYKIQDTRDDNQAPSWYRTHYGKRTVEEFKKASAIGLTDSGGTFVHLQTSVKWYDATGGGVHQSAVGDNGKRFARYSVGDNWSAWSETETVAGAQAKIDSERTARVAADEAHTRELAAAKSRLGAAESGISELRQTVTRENSATASRLDSLTAKLGADTNLINPATTQAGHYINESNGNVLNWASHVLTDFVPVAAGQTYTFTSAVAANNLRWAWYNAQRGFVSGRLVGGNNFHQTLVAPADAAFVRLSGGTNGNTRAFALRLDPMAAAVEAERVARVAADNALTQQLDTAKSQIGQQSAQISRLESTKADQSSVSAQLQTTLQAAARDAQSKADEAKTAAERTAQTKAAEAQAAAERAAQLKADAAKAAALASASSDAQRKADAAKAAAVAEAAAKDAVLKREAAADAQAKADAVRRLAEAARADITALQSTVAEKDRAHAQQIQTVQTTLNGVRSSVQTAATSINGLQAQYTVKVDANGHVAGYGLASEPVNGRPRSKFIVQADQFGIGATGKSTAYPFVVDTRSNTVGVNGALVVNGKAIVDKLNAGDINGSKIAANSITANHLQARSISGDKLAVTSLSAISSNLGTVTAGSLNIGGRFVVNNDGRVRIGEPNNFGAVWEDRGVVIYNELGDIMAIVGRTES